MAAFKFLPFKTSDDANSNDLYHNSLRAFAKELDAHEKSGEEISEKRLAQIGLIWALNEDVRTNDRLSDEEKSLIGTAIWSYEAFLINQEYQSVTSKVVAFLSGKRYQTAEKSSDLFPEIPATIGVTPENPLDPASRDEALQVLRNYLNRFDIINKIKVKEKKSPEEEMTLKFFTNANILADLDKLHAEYLKSDVARQEQAKREKELLENGKAYLLDIEKYNKDKLKQAPAEVKSSPLVTSDKFQTVPHFQKMELQEAKKANDQDAIKKIEERIENYKNYEERRSTHRHFVKMVSPQITVRNPKPEWDASAELTWEKTKEATKETKNAKGKEVGTRAQWVSKDDLAIKAQMENGVWPLGGRVDFETYQQERKNLGQEIKAGVALKEVDKSHLEADRITATDMFLERIHSLNNDKLDRSEHAKNFNPVMSELEAPRKEKETRMNLFKSNVLSELQKKTSQSDTTKTAEAAPAATNSPRLVRK